MRREKSNGGFGPRRPVISRVLVAAVAALCTLGSGTVLAQTAMAADATVTSAQSVTVHADEEFRSVTHVATGSLYGLSDANYPTDNLVQSIKPNEFVLKPIDGKQQPYGDIGITWKKADQAGAKVVDRLADMLPGWPYQYPGDDAWDAMVKAQIQKVKASGMTNLAAYAIWNESDNTWDNSSYRPTNSDGTKETYEQLWTRTYRVIRSVDATTPIQGPSFSDNISDMENFLTNAKATNTLPDVLAWHELESSNKIAGDIAKVEAIEDQLGIKHLPIDIEEYAAPSEIAIPGDLVGYIAKFERLGVHSAELAFWNPPTDALGDLLTAANGKPNGAYWLYTWYAQMSGNMVTTTPASDSTKFDAAASLTTDSKELDVITGGTSGSSNVVIDGLNKTKLGSKVNVKLEYTPTYGRTTAVSGPVTISDSTYTVGSDGSITVPIVAMNAQYGYHIVVTPATNASADNTGTYTIANLNSGLNMSVAQQAGTGSSVAQQSVASGDATQQWYLSSAGSGLYQIRNQSNGLALGLKNSATYDGTAAVVQANASGNDFLWQVIPDGNGHYKIANYGTGKVLAVDGRATTSGASVVQWTDGVITNSCSVSGPRQSGKVGKALDFCGSGSYATLPNGTVSGLTGDYTIAAWVKPESAQTWARVFDLGTAAGNSMYLTGNDGTGVDFTIQNGGKQSRIQTTTPLTQGVWSQVTVTFSGSTANLYVNGVLSGTATGVSVHPSDFGADSANYLGKSQYSWDSTFNGALDDVNIYSRALNATEVSALAQGTVGDGDVAHYTFAEPNGLTIQDSSTNHRDGSITLVGGGTTSATATSADTADHFWTLTAVPISTPTLSASTTSWSNGPVTVTAKATDGLSTTVVQLSVDGQAWDAGSTGHDSVSVGSDGVHTVRARSVDSAKNISQEALTTVKVDTLAPVVKASENDAKLVTVVAQDSGSGVASVQYRFSANDPWTDYAQPITARTGASTVFFQAKDNAGNVSQGSLTLSGDATAPSQGNGSSSGGSGTATGVKPSQNGGSAPAFGALAQTGSTTAIIALIATVLAVLGGFLLKKRLRR